MNIIPRSLFGVSIGQQKGNGYFNATALCKAYHSATGKHRDTSDWLLNKRTKESIKHLSSVVGIPATDLVIVVQGGKPDEQGTWLHPKLAIRFSIWLSDEIGYCVEEWAQEWISGKPQQQPQDFMPKLIEQMNIAEQLLLDVGVDPTIIKQKKLDVAAKSLPDVQEMIEAGKLAIASLTPRQSIGLTPTELGEQLNPSQKAKVVNEALADLGLQTKMHRQSTKNPAKTKSFWQVTDQGRQYSYVALTTAADWSGGQIRWYESVIPLLQQYLDSDFD